MESNMEGGAVGQAQSFTPASTQVTSEGQEGRVTSEMISGREYDLEPVENGKKGIDPQDNGSTKIVSIAKEKGFESAFESITDGSVFSDENVEKNRLPVSEDDKYLSDKVEREQVDKPIEQIEANEEVNDPEVRELTEKVLSQEAQIEELVSKNKLLESKVGRLENVQRKMIEVLLLMRKIDEENDEKKKKGLLESLVGLIGFLLGMLADPDKQWEEAEGKAA